MSAESISVPIADSAWTAPGWIHCGHFYSCIPHVAYPWDPAIVRALRTISPDVVPMIEISVYRWSNYHEQGKIGEPVVLVRHALGRAILDPAPGQVLHDFHCEMPNAPYDGLVIPGRTLAQSRPNHVETHWYDAGDRPLGHDLPGAYLPFDHAMYDICREFSDSLNRALAQSRREERADGTVAARGVGSSIVEKKRGEKEAGERESAALHADIAADINSYYREVPSDVEMKEIVLGKEA